jgi:hypothetical protein
LGAIGAVTALLAIVAAPAGATTTIGQLAPGTPPQFCDTTHNDFFNNKVSSGASYVVPPYSGTIANWSTNAAAPSGQQMTMKVFRKVGDPARYSVVAHDGPHELVGGSVNTFSVNIPVKSGDFVGVDSANAGTVRNACLFSVPGDLYKFVDANLVDGASADFSTSGGGARVNLTAVVKPSNTLTLGTVTDNPKNGSATLTATVPGPGELSLAGKGVKLGGPASSVTATGPGNVTLVVKPKGKTKAKLRRRGKAKVNVNVTYTPTGGDPASGATRIKLRQR